MSDQTNTNTTHSQPAWAGELGQKYLDGISHSFILHFGTADYAVPGVRVKSYLARMFAARDVIVYYNRAEGFSFPTPSMREAFLNAVDLTGNDARTAQELQLAGLAGDQGPNRNDPRTCLTLITRLLRGQKDGGAIAVIDYAETIVPENAGTPDDRTILTMVMDWGNDPAIIQSGNIAILLTRDLEDINSALRAASARFEAIEVPLPGYDERLGFINWFLNDSPVALADGLTVERVASLTSALSLMAIEDILLRAQREGVLTVENIKSRKKEIITSEYTDVLEVLDPERSFADIGDLDHIKAFMRRSVIDPVLAGNYARVPMGVLFTGPAGTGKSIMAEAVARESGLNCCVLNPAKLFDKYVGGTEQRVHRVFRAITSLAPAIVFVDEIDQSISRGETGDSGVSNRFFKSMLEFMSDTSHRGKVVFLAATNRPDMLDAALRRPGRFDKKIPFLVPDRDGRASILQVMMRRYMGVQEADIPAAVLDDTDNWTGAELEAATVKAVELMQDEGLDPVQAITEATRRMIPSTADIEYMTQIAIRECNDLDLLPPAYRNRNTINKAREATEAGDPGDVRRRRRDF